MAYSSTFRKRVFEQIFPPKYPNTLVPDVNSGTLFSHFLKITLPRSLDNNPISFKIPCCCINTFSRALNSYMNENLTWDFNTLFIGLHESTRIKEVKTTDTVLKESFGKLYIHSGVLLNKLRLLDSGEIIHAAPGIILDNNFNIKMCNYITYTIEFNPNGSISRWETSDIEIQLHQDIIINPSNFFYKAIIKKIIPFIHSELDNEIYSSYSAMRAAESHFNSARKVTTTINRELCQVLSVEDNGINIIDAYHEHLEHNLITLE